MDHPLSVSRAGVPGDHARSLPGSAQSPGVNEKIARPMPDQETPASRAGNAHNVLMRKGL
jgi:hypothetical protein